MNRVIAAIGWLLLLLILAGLVCMLEDADARTHTIAGVESGEYVVSTGPNDTGGTAIVSWEQTPPGKIYLGTFPFAGWAQVGVALASSGHQQWDPLTQVADSSEYISFDSGEPIYTDFIGEGWYTIFVFDPAGTRFSSKWRAE